MSKKAEELVTISEYARMRKLNKSTVSRQARNGVIVLRNGKVDVAQADHARSVNLSGFRPRKAVNPDRDAGIQSCVTRLLTAARTTWPRLVAEMNFDIWPADHRVEMKTLVLALMLRLNEGWVADWRPKDLPGVDFSPFGRDAAEVSQGVEELLREWR